jgi:hypothetical protein
MARAGFEEPLVDRKSLARVGIENNGELRALRALAERFFLSTVELAALIGASAPTAYAILLGRPNVGYRKTRLGISDFLRRSKGARDRSDLRLPPRVAS